MKRVVVFAMVLMLGVDLVQHHINKKKQQCRWWGNRRGWLRVFGRKAGGWELVGR